MLSISDLTARIRSGDLTPDGALGLTRRAIVAREPAVGAFVRLAPETSAATAGPLSGIAVAVKDIIDTADLPTEMGAAIYAGWQPRADAAIVAALRRAGATIVGKSTTTPFAQSDPTATRNPHDPEHTPGGSSAGSAAAVGAGMVPLALGTQTGGSVIRPASYCGAAAIKPSFRLLPTVGVKCLAWTLDTVGLFAAGVEDLAIALEAVSGRPMSEGGHARPPRVGLVHQSFAGEAEPESVAALDEAASLLSAVGAIVTEIDPPASLAEGWHAHPTIQDFECAAALGWEYDQQRERLPPRIRGGIETGRGVAAAAYDEARRIANRARRDARLLFADVDAVLTYSAPGQAPRGLGSTGSPRYNRLWTMLGTPCVNVPGLRSAAGLPVGVQVVAPFAQDAIALDVGRFVERVLAPART